MTEPAAAPATADVDALRRLREPLPDNLISKLPGGIPKERKDDRTSCRVCGGYHGPASYHVDYAGHAAITDRLLDVDPLWWWEPLAYDERGLPRYETDPTGKPIGLWIRLHIGGYSRLGFGDAVGKPWGPTAIKEVIGDAIRNAAMRYGVGLDLWHKGTLEGERAEEPADDTDRLLDADECVSAVYAADTLAAIGVAAKRFRGGRAAAETAQVADPGTGEVTTLLAFATACRDALTAHGEPLRVRRAREHADAQAATVAQDAAERDGTVPANPSAVGHGTPPPGRRRGETAAERAQRIADEMAAAAAAGERADDA